MGGSMNRDTLLSTISIRMQAINQEINELKEKQHKLYDEKSELIASWERETNISKDELKG
jgi:FtsZ-binding cell division protein ZapB